MLFGDKYPDTYRGGQQCREDVDALKVIMHTKEPEGYGQYFLLGFKNGPDKKKLPWDDRGWHPDPDKRTPGA